MQQGDWYSLNIYFIATKKKLRDPIFRNIPHYKGVVRCIRRGIFNCLLKSPYFLLFCSNQANPISNINEFNRTKCCDVLVTEIEPQFRPTISMYLHSIWNYLILDQNHFCAKLFQAMMNLMQSTRDPHVKTWDRT